MSGHLTENGRNQEQTSHLRRAAYVAAALILLAAIWVNMSGASATPLQISLNGAQVVVSARQSVEQIIREYEPELLSSGDLIDVEGETLELGEGDKPVLTVNGKVVKDDYRVQSGDVIRVTPGTERVEGTEIQYEHTSLKFDQEGRGPMPVVTDPGQTGIIKSSVGKISGKVLSRIEVRESVQPVVRYSMMPDPKLKVVALTFDDGPNPGETESILRILKKEKVKATFFFIGASVDKYPEIARRAAKAGHQIGAHSVAHKSYTTMDASQLAQDVHKSISSIERACGVEVGWVRPPYGAVNGTVYSVIDRMSLRVALWSVDPKDWGEPGFQKIINRVVFGAHPGAVVLFHDGGGERSQTVKALPGIIGELRDAGYRFVTMEEYAILADEFSKGK